MKRIQRQFAAVLSLVIVAIPFAAFMPWNGTNAAEEMPRSSAEPSSIISPSPILTLAPEPEETEYIPDAAEVEALAKMLYGEARGIASDMDANEKPVEREAISIAYSGKTLKPLQTRRGLVFIESRYLSPVSDILDVLELYERITPGGTPYIVAKAGFLLQAVIMPYDVISQQFVDNLKRLTEQCVLSLDLREREKELARAAEPEQYSLNVDPATGEIVEDESEVVDNA